VQINTTPFEPSLQFPEPDPVRRREKLVSFPQELQQNEKQRNGSLEFGSKKGRSQSGDVTSTFSHSPLSPLVENEKLQA